MLTLGLLAKHCFIGLTEVLPFLQSLESATKPRNFHGSLTQTRKKVTAMYCSSLQLKEHPAQLFCILSLVLCFLSEGVCEIWLTSEDTGAYGRDIGTDLPTLLWRLVEEIPEGAMLRLGMTNPPYILEHLEVGLVDGPHLTQKEPNTFVTFVSFPSFEQLLFFCLQ